MNGQEPNRDFGSEPLGTHGPSGQKRGLNGPEQFRISVSFIRSDRPTAPEPLVSSRSRGKTAPCWRNGD
uniref:Uncharacterized protein n=1 Tax=Anguilla anguilla TaxID=7936 RepID=A0A0E9ULQ8_ANGAN